MRAVDAEILRLYGEGMLLKNIAARVGLKPHSVGQILKRLGVDRPSKPQKKIVEIDETSVVEIWDRGWSVSAIAERFQVSDSTIRRIIISSGRVLDGRTRYDGEGGSIHRGGAIQRIARRT